MMNENETITPGGAGESGRKTVDFAKINDKLRARLKTVAAIAEAALANQPNEHDQCWDHLLLALGKIETQMLIHNAEKPLDPNAPEMVRGEKPDEKKAIGNFAGVGKVVSYAIGRDMTVTVTARTTDGRTWNFNGIKNGETAIMGTILGGRWAAAHYCKFIRNGIVSRLMRIKKNHARLAEKAASALAGARSDAGKAVAE